MEYVENELSRVLSLVCIFGQFATLDRSCHFLSKSTMEIIHVSIGFHFLFRKKFNASNISSIFVHILKIKFKKMKL